MNNMFVGGVLICALIALLIAQLVLLWAPTSKPDSSTNVTYSTDAKVPLLNEPEFFSYNAVLSSSATKVLIDFEHPKDHTGDQDNKLLDDITISSPDIDNSIFVANDTPFGRSIELKSSVFSGLSKLRFAGVDTTSTFNFHLVVTQIGTNDKILSQNDYDVSLQAAPFLTTFPLYSVLTLLIIILLLISQIYRVRLVFSSTPQKPEPTTTR